MQRLAGLCLIGIIDTATMKRTLADNLKRLRLARKLTQEDLGAATGLKQTAISRYEKGKAKPDLSSLLKLAVGLRARVETIVEGLDVKFDAFYQGLRLSIQTDGSDPDDGGANLAEQQPPFDVIVPGAPPGESDDAVPNLAETHAEFQRLLTELISISARLAPRSPPVARDVGPPVRQRTARSRVGKGRAHSAKTPPPKRQ